MTHSTDQKAEGSSPLQTRPQSPRSQAQPILARLLVRPHFAAGATLTVIFHGKTGALAGRGKAIQPGVYVGSVDNPE